MRLVHKRQIQRTFWHSGMLLILCSLCALVPRAGSNTVPSQGSRVASIQVNSELVQNGYKVRRDDVASSVSCDMPGAEGSVTVWKFNGEPISDLNTVQSSKEEGRLECYASSGEFQSLAFVVVSEDGGNSGGEQSGEIVSGPVPVSRAAEGATFKFQCKISPPAGNSGKTQWLKNGRQPPLENGGTMAMCTTMSAAKIVVKPVPHQRRKHIHLHAMAIQRHTQLLRRLFT